MSSSTLPPIRGSRHPPRDLHDVNVEGTRHVLAFAHRCPRLEQFLFVSTTCVAGTRTGVIHERLEDEPAAFLNPYERTKWEAERLAAAADLPVRIARLSTCIGDEQTGYVHRFGAIHQALRWLIRGLVPLVPAVEGSRVDLIATGVAARWIARAAEQPGQRAGGLSRRGGAAGDPASRPR